MSETSDPMVERALAVARRTHAAPVPAGLADRVARGALAAGPAHDSWWTLALPIAWRSALALNAVALLAWVLLRSAPPATPGIVEQMVDAEVDAMLSRTLGVREVAP